MIKKAAIKAIDFYRNYISILKLPTCRYYPTCSRYASDAICKYGALKGVIRGFFRLLRCNPLFKGGFDPA